MTSSLDVRFKAKLVRLTECLEAQFTESAHLEAHIQRLLRANLEKVSYGA